MRIFALFGGVKPIWGKADNIKILGILFEINLLTFFFVMYYFLIPFFRHQTSTYMGCPGCF